MFRSRTQSTCSGLYSSSVVRLCLPTRHLALAPVPLPPFVAILDAASSISPVFATLTKNTRGGVYSSSSANSVPSVLRLTRPQSPTDPVDPRRHPTDTIPLIIRSSAKGVRNSCRMRSFKTQDLKPFRICSYRKPGRGRGLSSKGTASPSLHCRLPALSLEG